MSSLGRSWNGGYRSATGNEGSLEPGIYHLLSHVRSALASEPSAATGPPSIGPRNGCIDSVADVRAALSVTVGSVAMRLNKAGFTQPEQLYRMRDRLAAGQPVGADALNWLDRTIAALGGHRFGFDRLQEQ
jgi:hypothetical protein